LERSVFYHPISQLSRFIENCENKFRIRVTRSS